MLAELLKFISPQTLTPNVTNSSMTQAQKMLSIFDDTYKSFGKALDEKQQVFISNNMDKVSAYFKSETGKQAIAVLVEEFETFVKKA